ncbi:hypothetical protein OZN62_09930 [Aurantiacibacter sp. MUD11]|uniref:hypothetical protein n=1 Tax=Aurantiacibacter sp. MUD11 TaxID=3003265 RepID=UPI0022AB1592|nr:hypothetical protein [Aurantiacibacter sp. MUD11]WAT17247.1 hypothetical protein OZN62_09930 [Aurantiacibacter sp. MUD11]
MFEGKPPAALDSRNSATGTAPEDALCELTWTDLVTKLKAARELRAELAHGEDALLASFDAGSARHLASHLDALRQYDDERGVNPDDLGNGKGACGKANERADRETPATRGNT